MNFNWKLTYRSLLARKSFLLINVFGLSVAIASSIVILLFSRYELSYDSFHEKSDRIHLVVKERNTAQGVIELSDTWVPLLPLMQGQYPAIENGVRLYYDDRWVEVADQKYRETITFADPSFFEVFSFPLLQGDAASVLEGTTSAVISSELAQRYFGTANPIGQRLTINFDQDFLVTGVLDEYPMNSSIIADLIVPLESQIAPDDEAANNNWGGSYIFTYLLLTTPIEAPSLEQEFLQLIETQFGTEGANGTDNMRLRLWPVETLRNQAVGNDVMAYMLLGIAFAIIVISCVNFMNLATARSMERGREVGVRKTLGAARSQLAVQFLAEAALVSVIALGVGAVLAELLLPVFNALFQLQLDLHLFTDLPIILLLIGVGLVSSILSGGYPAFFISGYKITDSIRGNLKSRPQGTAVRSALSVLQFTLAIMLSIGLVLIWQQVQHMKNSSLNFDVENILVIPTSLRDFPDAELAASRVEAFKQEVLQIPGVRSVASSMSVPGNYVNLNTFATPEDWDQPEPLRMLLAGADDFYFETYGMEFIEGRNFSREFATERNSIILNETAMRDMNWDSAIGKQVNERWTVVGVVEDFNFESLEDEVRAVIHIYGPQDSTNHNYISLKLETNNVQSVIAALEASWLRLDPTRPFSYFFMEDSINELYRDVDNITTVIGYFCLLSLFIANLGLMGMSSYAVVQRTKEIGIRKVLGSSVIRILSLLSSQFTRPVLIANLIAWPLSFLLISGWLENFAYRIDVSWLVFVISGLAVLVLAVATVCLQSLKTVTANPVKALRYE